ncbi:MAG: SAM-dependent chlorinase/fluorinase [Calditrichaeota bacterium]|nr:SAM-dependent chlorinase/fluorinase [Calditrichota bacterium]
MTPIITLLTDFGTQDSFVGEMKGSIARICPEANVIDLTHEIPSHNVEHAAFAWKTATASFPKGSVHVGVVDPGVGTSRKALAAEIDGSFYVCPDNGMLSWILEDAASAKIVAADNPQFWRPWVSSTFHGRDIFAPVAAHLACGVPLGSVGHVLRTPKRLRLRKPQLQGKTIIGHPMLADRFGNVLTNLPNALLEMIATVEFGGHRCKPVRTFAEGKPGEFLVLQGSHGYLEIALNRASVLTAMRDAMTATVVLHLKDSIKG